MTILGISALYHDSAAALIRDGQILAAAQEERFTRVKHDSSFPIHAIQYCMEYAGIDLEDLDAIAFYDKPLLKFERLLETYYAFAPKGLMSFIAAMPVWLREKMFLKRLIHEELGKIGSYDKRGIKLLFPEHHLSHAASAFYPSGFERAAILTLDGVGEWATASIGIGDGSKIKILKELQFPHSVGLLYSAFTYFLGFRVNSGEYKLMGLAPYGNPADSQVDEFVRIIKNDLVEIYADGSLWLNQEYFDYAAGLRMVKEGKWARLFGFPRREPGDDILQHHSNLALAIQMVTEDIVIQMARHAKEETGANVLCMAGGVALNCVANGKLESSGLFDNIFIQPAAGDAGGALGAALAAQHLSFDVHRHVDHGKDDMQGSYLGPEYSDLDIEQTIRKFDAVAQKCESQEALTATTAQLLSGGNVVGWMQGRMEFGPRALGSRSILGDARNSEMQKKLNLKIKYRESFRPFAPSILAEDLGQYFDSTEASPYMLMVREIKEDFRSELPSNYFDLPMMDRLYIERSHLPAVTHIDFSARVQSVHKDTNPRYWTLINDFKRLTGQSAIINTSFNVRGEPIVCSPEDAYRCFMRTEMDVLVVGNYVFHKSDQPEWKDKGKWQEEFKLD